jgi:hypothetical protein
MSLFKQLLIAICVFLVVAFSGSFIVSLESSRAQYVNQLRFPRPGCGHRTGVVADTEHR